jgi:hypothetical protein
MKVLLTSARLDDVISSVPEEHRKQFYDCANTSRQLWVGLIEGNVVCVWGLIPPTLLSSRAYLWLYTTDNLDGNEFLFVRHSQRAIEEMLKEYSVIYGHTEPGLPRTHRWLRWLGAQFGEQQNGLIPFEIRKKDG